jgi:hypothetical protein
VRDDYPFDGAGGEARYFNAGVMVINLERWRQLNVQEKLLSMITASPQKFRWWDQTAMNVLFQGQVHFVDPAWNTFADSVNFSPQDSGRIFHFVGGTKPWGRYLDTPEFRLWRAFFGRHALPKLCLFFDRKLALSFLQFLRHRALCHSRMVQFLAAGVVRCRALLAGRSGVEALAQFRQRHTGADVPEDRPPALSDARMENYIHARWG